VDTPGTQCKCDAGMSYQLLDKGGKSVTKDHGAKTQILPFRLCAAR
jgi:hypothetical protein